jgi:small-conductance mechanosensitive channel
MVRRATGKSRLGFRVACAVAAALLLFGASTAFAVDEPIKAATDRLEQIRAELDRIEAAAGNPDQSRRALIQYREEVEPLRTELREIAAKIEPLHAQTEKLLKQLGPSPSADKPPETLAVASEREQQTIALRDADAALRQARLLAERGDQIAEAIDIRRRTAFTDLLFERDESFFAPALWLRAIAELPDEWRARQALMTDSYDDVIDGGGLANLALAILISLGATLAILLLRAAARKRVSKPDAAPADGEIPLLPKSHKAVLAARDALLSALTLPAISVAILEIFTAFGLLPGPIRPLAASLVTAIVLFSIARALTRAVLSPHNSRRRLNSLDDASARGLYRLLLNASALTAFAMFVNDFHRAMSTSVAITVATSALYAALIAFFLVIMLLATRGPAGERKDAGMPPWIRLSGWLVATVIIVALAAGYIRFAALVAERVVTAAIVLVGLALVLALVDAIFGQGLKHDSPRRRSFAATLGLRVKTLDLFAALFAGLLRTILVLAAVFIVIGTLTTSAVDLSSALDQTAFTFVIGETRIRLADIAIAFVILLAGIAVTRILYRWLSHEVLPRTELEPSLQNSIATIAGYAGVIVAISVALARLGVNLENIALVAGALSIGIGFGLQAIVSNFVSGLILLTERPIRVGDWIVVKGEEGYVRKISVRSTEIETFERASVILPNSDLITGVVKNWTHSDKLGRLSVPVGVSYDSDPDQVCEILASVAAEHPLVLKDPPPFVLFMRFGDSSLDFELRAVVADINKRLSTVSDLHFTIFRQFREAGIEIPFPQRDIHIKSAPAEAEDPPEDGR